MLPDSLAVDLKAPILKVKALHEKDLAAGNGRVDLPHAFDRKSPRADSASVLQYVFPSSTLSAQPGSESGSKVRSMTYKRESHLPV